MKISKISILATAIILGCVSCTKDDTTDNGTSNAIETSAPSIDITINEQRYYGLALKREVIGGDTEGSEFSCLLLSPWDNRPDASITLQGNVSTIILPSGEFKIVGRRICATTASGDWITVYPDEIPVEAFSSPEALNDAATTIMNKPNKAQMATPRKPSD